MTSRDLSVGGDPRGALPLGAVTGGEGADGSPESFPSRKSIACERKGYACGHEGFGFACEGARSAEGNRKKTRRGGVRR